MSKSLIQPALGLMECPRKQLSQGIMGNQVALYKYLQGALRKLGWSEVRLNEQGDLS